jgi:hypothetical protein
MTAWPFATLLRQLPGLQGRCVRVRLVLSVRATQPTSIVEFGTPRCALAGAGECCSGET